MKKRINIINPVIMRAILYACFILMSSAVLNAQQKDSLYAQHWQRVYQFELKALPKSASTVVDSIYVIAKQEKNTPQYIKALLYQAKFALTLEEDAQLKIIRLFEEEIAVNDFPARNILQNVLADILWQYFQQNRWRIYNRSATEEKVDSTDFRTWDLHTLLAEIHTHFQRSLQQTTQLQAVDLNNYNSILERFEDSKIYRPTLFDFLVHNALQFYKADETGLSKPGNMFTIDDPNYFQNFENITLRSPDSLSLAFQALLLYKPLLAFHKQDDDPSAYVNLELERLRFVVDKSVIEDKNERYEEALQALKTEFINHPASTLVDFELATMLNEEGNTYEPITHEENQFKKSAAVKLCNAAIVRFSDSAGAKKCQLLRDHILSVNLSLLIARLLVNYSNVDSLRFTAYPLNPQQWEEFRQLRSDSSQLAYISRLKKGKSWMTRIINKYDHQKHSTEVVVPALDQGAYLIVANVSSPTDITTEVFAYGMVQVTNMALIENTFNDINRYQVVNRNTGEPLEGIQVHLKNYNPFDTPFDKIFTTNEDGFVEVKGTSTYMDVKIGLSGENDSANFGRHFISQRYSASHEKDDYVNAKTFLFTDRSIYRPGQTVYFKGILIQTSGGKSSIVAGEYVEVYMEDVNGDEVGFLRLKTNKYGSFSGEFTLPSSGLNGEYTLYVDEDYEEYSKFYDKVVDNFEWSEHYISVEEYKRPTFEASFEAVTGTYQLNDTITVRGTAESFSGAQISNAKVTYRVQRMVQYPIWYQWHHGGRNFYSEPQEITHGEITTDADGSFTIDFIAIPDLKVAKDGLPVFTYKVDVDVTDITGETRSASTAVKVGYHTMLATVTVPGQIDRNTANSAMAIHTTNLNGQAIPAKGKISVYKLSSPDRPLRKRPWEAPDLQAIAKKEFTRLFPHDPYTDDPENQPKGDPIWEETFNTDLAEKMDLPASKDWPLGNYLIELKTTDSLGQEVTDMQKFTLYDSKTDEIADNRLLLIEPDKISYNLGDKVRLKVASASKDITITLDVEKENKVVDTHLIHLSDESKVITIPVNRDDVEGFAIQYSMVNYNSFENGTVHILVNDPRDELQIKTLTFRDKILPGAEETWSFAISGPRSERSSVEFLASMYDASLDQFKPHQWSFNPAEQRGYYAYNRSSAYQSFRNESFDVKNLKRWSYQKSYQRFDQLNWFGFSLTHHNWANKRYLNALQASIVQQKSTIISQNDSTRKSGYVFGKIIAEDGEALTGVNITIKGTNKGTISDLNGDYMIAANKGDELVFSFVGMSTITTKVDNNNIIDVQLAADIQHLSEVVVVGYGVAEQKSMVGSIAEVANEEVVFADLDVKLSGQIAGVHITNSDGSNAQLMIRGMASLDAQSAPLYVVDGVIVENMQIAPEDLASVNVLKGAAATSLYGDRGANGVMIITTKSGQKKMDEALAKVQARHDFKETAFFFPHLTTNRKGEITFKFTAPETLTRWKLQLLAHSKKLVTGIKTLQSVTQKDFMVVPNAPRFLRKGDRLQLSTKITNLTSLPLHGVVALQLFDGVSGEPVDEHFLTENGNKNFQMAANSNTEVAWELDIPDQFEALQYRIVAKAGDFSDGEQNMLPILSDRKLVTETLPMAVRSGETKTFTLEKLKNTTSPTLQHHQLTLEVTANPVWYAIQALPYLMEFPYECSEQTFARFYANRLARHLVQSNPKIKDVIHQWKGSGALESNLEKNQALKSIIIEETPWLRDARSESEQKKRLALLFDLAKVSDQLDATINKLAQMQMSDGGFPWFGGGRSNRFISQHIATGFGHLKHLNVSIEQEKAQEIIDQLIKYLDQELLKDYKELLYQASANKEDTGRSMDKILKEHLQRQHIRDLHVQYLYMRSFFSEKAIPEALKEAIDYYKDQSAIYWKDFGLYLKGMVALIHFRDGNGTVARDILHSLDETSITTGEMGMYWKENKRGWRWNEAPVETQALMIEAFSEIQKNDTTLSAGVKNEKLDNLRIWLLRRKQTNQWESTKATTEAIYALLLHGSDLMPVTEQVEITVGNQNIEPSENAPEAGTGYFKRSWKEPAITRQMSEVTLSKKGPGIVWGGLYWQYFEELDKVTSSRSPLQLSRRLFLVNNTDQGELLTDINAATTIQPGDLIRVRIELKADRAMEFLHMKDMRASGLEPVDVISEYKWQDGLGYYQTTKDASTNFFFDDLLKGVYVFEYDLRVNNKGNFSTGITTIQSMYAPEFSSHSDGGRIVVSD